MELQQSQTYKNLQSAFNAECNTSTKYQLYAEKARAEGYIEIGNIYDITARNERSHAEIWEKQLNNGTFPDTLTNLKESSKGETYDGANTYREYARIAREEGFTAIASLFDGVANIEMNHDLRFQSLADSLQAGEFYCKQGDVLWICMVCGNILSGKCAPTVCPICGYPQGYYELYSETY